MEIEKLLSLEFSLRPVQVQNIINLLDEGCTIPFIARYRKELTGGVDDQTLRAFDDRLKYLRNLEKRKEEVTKAITEQGNMTEEIQQALNNAGTLTEVEDIYRPFKPKRKTRASVAIAKGLEPLADFILSQKGGSIEEKATEFISEEKGVNSIEEAISGAKDIIAEKISDNASLRKVLREMLVKKGHIKAKLDDKKEGHETYEMYADFDADVSKTPSHRILAMNRGENEGCLKVDLDLNEELALNKIESEFIVKNSPYQDSELPPPHRPTS